MKNSPDQMDDFRDGSNMMNEDEMVDRGKGNIYA